MADSCSELAAQIAALRAEVAAIPRVNEGDILARAAATARDLIQALAPGIATAVAVGLIKPVAAQADMAKLIADDAKGQAGQAQGTAGSALAKVLSLAALIASLLGVLGTVAALGTRIDALENQLEGLARDVGGILGSILPGIKALAQQALGTAGQAIREVGDVRSSLSMLYAKVDSLSAFISQVSSVANRALDNALRANEVAMDARARAMGLETIVRPLPKRIEKAENDADKALRNSETASLQAESAEDLARKAFLKPAVKGDKGDKGDPGVTTTKVVEVPTKVKGDKGDRGIPGIKGDKGDPGTNAQTIIVPTREVVVRTEVIEKTLPGMPGAPGRPGRDGIDGKDLLMDDATKAMLARIDSRAALIPALVSRPSPLTTPQTVAAAAAGTCSTTKPGGCMANAFDKNANDINQNSNANTGRIMDKLNAGLQIPEIALLSVINNKLGAQVPGGISAFLNTFFDKFTKFTKWVHLDRILNILTWWQTLHNGYMLSSNLGQTMFSVVENLLNIMGIKDADGDEIDVSKFVGGAIDSFAQRLLGVSTWNGIKKEWKKYNRIYQAAANMLNTLSSIYYSIFGVLEVLGNRISKIGNALRWYGTVQDRAYSWMNENNSFTNPVLVALEKANDKADALDSISSDVLNVKEQSKELAKNRKEFNSAIESLAGKEDKKEKTETDKIKVTDSENKDD
ncbi:MAG: hypothetical protein ACIWVG_20375 [Gloeotrichia echinulata HAB0833]